MRDGKAEASGPEEQTRHAHQQGTGDLTRPRPPGGGPVRAREDLEHLLRRQPGALGSRRAADVLGAPPVLAGRATVDGGVDAVEQLVGRPELGARDRAHPPQGVLPGLVLERDDAELLAPAGLQVLLDGVDPLAVPAGDGHLSRRDLHVAVDLVDAGVVAEVLTRVDQRVDRAQHVQGVGVDVLAPPGSRLLQRALARQQVVDPGLGLLDEPARQTAQAGQLGAVGVDRALQPEQGQQHVAGVRAQLAHAAVVQQAPEREHRVQVGVVGVDRPVALGELETAVHQQQGLLAGGQGEEPLAAGVMVEVVELPLVVDQRSEVAGAVQQDDAFPQGGGRGSGGRHLGIDDGAHPGRLVALEEADAVLLAQRVSLRDRRASRGGSGYRLS